MEHTFFCPTQTKTHYTNKSGGITDLKHFAATQNKKLISMQQVHGNMFSYCTSEMPLQNVVLGVDGILTNRTDLVLSVKTADCLPILLHHPSGIIGAVHAGRKSTQLHLLEKTLLFLRDKKGIVSDISLWFGPAICVSCYQVDEKTDTHYDLLEENKQQAYTVFSPSNIAITFDRRCTKCLSESFYSYRVEGAGVPMNLAAITLR